LDRAETCGPSRAVRRPACHRSRTARRHTAGGSRLVPLRVRDASVVDLLTEAPRSRRQFGCTRSRILPRPRAAVCGLLEVSGGNVEYAPGRCASKGQGSEEVMFLRKVSSIVLVGIAIMLTTATAGYAAPGQGGGVAGHGGGF